MKLYLAALAHETNSFSPLPTTLRSFADGIDYTPGAAGSETRLAEAIDFPGFGDLRDAASARGDTVTVGPCYWAQPGGLVARAAYDALSAKLLDGLRAAMNEGAVDGVMLVLHGAMMAHGLDDCEGDLLTRVRALVGPRVPVGVLLDLHGNLTPTMLDSGALLIACKEYPHTDYPARAAELVTLLHAMHEQRVTARVLMQRIPVLAMFGTTEGPMRALVDHLAVCEQQAGVLSVSLMHGFPWSDAYATSAAVLVLFNETADDTGEAAANAAGIAADVAARLFALRGSGAASLLGVDQAIDAALAHPYSGKPVVLADVADNAGGGAAGDSTFILRALVERNIEDAALAMIWDPQAVRIAIDAGVGARLPLRLGGKVGAASGDPLDVVAEVTAIAFEARQHGLSGTLSEPLGAAVALRVGGVDIVVNSIRQQVFSPACFTELGIDPAAKRIVVVKSTRHFRARYDPLAALIVYCDTPGALNAQLADLPFAHIRRPVWPLDAVEACGSDITHGARLV